MKNNIELVASWSNILTRLYLLSTTHGNELITGFAHTALVERWLQSPTTETLIVCFGTVDAVDDMAKLDVAVVAVLTERRGPGLNPGRAKPGRRSSVVKLKDFRSGMDF